MEKGILENIATVKYQHEDPQPVAERKLTWRSKLIPYWEKAHPFMNKFLICLFAFASLYGILGEEILPGSELFSLILLGTVAFVMGIAVSFIWLPPLVGMLLAGFLFGNLPFIPYSETISLDSGSTLRSSALVVILLRAGLGLDYYELARLSRIVFQLSFSPLAAETIAVAAGSFLFLGLPVSWAFMLGFVVAAVSPAVIVPSMVEIQKKGYGLKKGIPTLIIAASSVDDILAIVGFTVTFGISMSQSSSLMIYAVIRGILNPFGGLILGVIFGKILWHFPGGNRSPQNEAINRVALLCLCGFALMFVSHRTGFASAGPMACLALAFICAVNWKQDRKSFEEIENALEIFWCILQPLLFSLIGMEIKFSKLKNIGYVIATLVIGLSIRLFTAGLVTCGGNLNVKEKIYVAIAWLPKATVQAAIGPQALDYVLTNGLGGGKLEDYAYTVLTGAVLSIVMTAPLGSILITLLGPHLLTNDLDSAEVEVCVVTDNHTVTNVDGVDMSSVCDVKRDHQNDVASTDL